MAPILRFALYWVEERFEQLRDEMGRCHPSHPAARALEEAEDKFRLGTHGVEGDCVGNGSFDHLYLNTGFLEVPTLVYYKGKFDIRDQESLVIENTTGDVDEES